MSDYLTNTIKMSEKGFEDYFDSIFPDEIINAIPANHTSNHNEEQLQKNKEEALERKRNFLNSLSKAPSPKKVSTVSPIRKIISPCSTTKNEVNLIKTTLNFELFSSNEILLRYNYPLIQDTEEIIKKFQGIFNREKNG